MTKKKQPEGKEALEELKNCLLSAFRMVIACVRWLATVTLKATEARKQDDAIRK